MGKGIVSISKQFVVILLAAWLAFLLAAFGGSIPPSGSAPAAQASGPTEVGGPITADTTWTAANSPYIVTSSVLVMLGATLSIEPGVVVKFNPDRALRVDGQLIARGSGGNPIVFTSNQPQPAGGDWGYIQFTDSSVDATYDGNGNYAGGSIMQHCAVEYGGGGANVNGAIMIESSSPFIDRCTISGSNRDGIHINNTADNITIRDSTVHSNEGNGIYGTGGGFAITNCAIEGNKGTGIFIYSSQLVTLDSCNIERNLGGGIKLIGGGGNFVISNCNVSLNSETGIELGGNVYSGAHVDIHNSTVSDNVAYRAAGISLWFATGTIDNCNISHNTAAYFGGIGILGASISISNSIISHNSVAGNGGGIHIDEGAPGAASLVISNCQIHHNSATGNGGGIATSLYYGAPVSLTIEGSQISNNYAGAAGGGIYAKGTVNISNSSVVDNSSNDYPALHLMQAEGNVSHNTIVSNSAIANPTSSAIYIAGHPSLNYNNIYSNDTDYQLKNGNPQGSPNLNAMRNWWGTPNEAEILDKIYDWFDNASLGIVNYSPYLRPPVGFADNLWNFRWNGDDRFHDNEPWLRPWDGSNESQGRWVGNWTYEVPWTQTYTQASGSVGGMSWNVSERGNLHVSADRDHQWHAWTYIYVSSPKSITIGAGGDCVPRCFLNYAFDSPYQFLATLNLKAGWNRIDITGYNQNSGYSFDLNYALADNVDILNSSQRESPFIVGTIPTIFTDEDTPFSYDLTVHKFDLKDAGGNLVWSVGGVDTGLFSASVDVESDDLTIIPAANAWGSDIVTLTLTDSQGLTATQDIEVTILPINDPPAITPPIPNQFANANVPITIDLTPYESDVDDSNLDLRWYVTGEDHCIVTGEYGDDDVITFTPNADYVGDDLITLHLVDSEGATTSQEVKLVWGGSISGHVYEANGQTPIAGATVRVWNYAQQSPLQAPPVGQATTDSNGYYKVIGLTAGEYRGSAWAPNHAVEFYQETFGWNQAHPVSVVQGQEISDINFTLAPGGTIEGNISDATTGLPLSQVSVMATFADGSPGGMVTTSDASGNYILKGLPYANYVVQSPAPLRQGAGDDNYVVEWWQEKASPVTVSQGVNPTAVNFTLQQGGSILGFVYEANSTTPIQGAFIGIQNYDTGEGLPGATTQQDGSYTIRYLPSGNYRLNAWAPDHVRKYWQDTVWHHEATPVSVTPGQDMPGISFNLGPGGTISGTITDQATGLPLANVSVDCSRVDSPGGGGATTNQNGTYTITGLPLGQYKVNSPSSGRRESGDDNYAREYYNNKLTSTSADLVTISATSPDATGVNFSLELGGSISGVVTDEQGQPIANLHVYATNYDTNEWIAGTNTRSDGTYTLSGLPPGDYRVRACASCSNLPYADEYYNDTYNYQQAASIPVVIGQDTAGKDFVLAPGGSISGVVKNADGSQTLAGMHVRSERVDGTFGQGTCTSSDGTYSLKGLPYGQYKVYAESGGECGGATNYMREYWNNKTNQQQADIVTISQGVNPAGVDFTLQQGGSISGVITDEQGQPIANLHVYATNYDTNEWIAGTNTRSDGTYTLTGLPSGNFRVRTCASCSNLPYADEYYDDTYNYQQAASIPVTVGQDTAGKDFVLAPGGSISGVVKNADGSLTLSGMYVQADSVDGTFGQGTCTGSDGTYSLKGLPYGRYKVYAESGGKCGGATNYMREYWNNKPTQQQADIVTISQGVNPAGVDFTLEQGGSVSGKVLDQDTGGLLEDASYGSIHLDAGWHKFVYRYEEREGVSEARAAFKSPGDADWRWFSTSELEIRTAPDPGAQSGILLTTKKNNSNHPRNHEELVRCVDQDSTPEPGWYGESVVSIVNQSENIHGNDDYFTSYYEGYFRVDTPGTWWFSTDSDDASEIVIDDQVVAYWYDGHGSANRWEHKGRVTIWKYESGEWVNDVSIEADGSYTIGGLLSGNYRLQARAPGYVSEFYDNTADQNSATPVPVDAPAQTSGINFALKKWSPPTGSISGVVSYTGSVSGSHLFVVRAVTEAGPSGPTYAVLPELSGPADYPYTISGLPDGKYRIVSYLDADDSGGHPSLGDPLVFSDWITISGGSQLAGVDLILVDPTGSISGEISYSGQVTGGHKFYVVVLTRMSPGTPLYPMWYVDMAKPGPYNFSGVPDGTYFVQAFLDADDDWQWTVLPPPWEIEPGDPRGSYRDPVSIAGGSHAGGVDIVVYDPSSIRGNVTYVGSVGGSHRIYVGAFSDPFHPVTATIQGNSGSYTIPNLMPGGYALAAFLDSNDDGIYEPGEPLAIYPHTVVVQHTDVVANLTLADPTGSISGHVTYTGSHPGYKVGLLLMALPSSRDFPVFVGGFFGKGFGGLADVGAYSISGIPDGTYMLFAVYALDDNWNFVQGVPLTFNSYGAPDLITISGGSVGNIDIVLDGVERGWVSGTVKLQGRQDYRNARVVYSADSVRLETATFGGGYYMIFAPLGGFDLAVEMDGYLSATTSGEMIEGGFDTGGIGMSPVTLLGGDINGDGNIDILDLTALAASFNTSASTNPAADINGDGRVDIFDLVLAGMNFGKTKSLWQSE